MSEFPRTTVGGVSLPRLLIGTNWFLGYSHTSQAKTHFITEYQTVERIAEVLKTFLEYGIDAVMAPPSEHMENAVKRAEDATGKALTRIWTPAFNVLPDGPPETTPERMIDYCKELNATFCFPHTSTTDALLDKMHGNIRDLAKYTTMIRDRGMIPGLSTHHPESIVYADNMDADVESYIQIYNAAGFLMHVEVDWVMQLIRNAKKPVMTIKPLAAGRLLPVVGLAYSWSTIREQDMITIGTITPKEAHEVIEISLDLLARRVPDNELQTTRSKKSLIDP